MTRNHPLDFLKTLYLNAELSAVNAPLLPIHQEIISLPHDLRLCITMTPFLRDSRRRRPSCWENISTRRRAFKGFETARWEQRWSALLRNFAMPGTHVDPSVQLKTLGSVLAPKLRIGRFKATDKLLAALEQRIVMQSSNPSK